jgi:hypothetical protein
MIKHITNGPGIRIAGNNSSAPYIDMSRPSAGILRYNGSNLEVYDGSIWTPINVSYPQIELDQRVQEIIHWAELKMREEEHIKALAAKHPTVADALLARDRAEDAVKIAAALCNTQ